MKVNRQELLNELDKELKLHQNGGTSYRQKTAELSVELVKQTADPNAFRNRLSTLATVDDLLGHADRDRKNDVSKMVSVIVKDLDRQKTQPAGMAEYVNRKKKNRKPLAFVKK